MRASSRQIRWALLLTTAAMAVVLLVTGMWSMTSARAAARSLTRSEAIGASIVVRRAVRLAGAIDSAMLDETLADLRSQGVTYIAVLTPDGAIAASAGRGRDASGWLPAEPDLRPYTQWSRTGFGVRLDSALFEGPGRRAGGGWLMPDAQAPADAGKGHRPWQAMRARRLVLELESDGARSLAARARLTMLADLIAAGLLLGLTAVFWRFSRQAEIAAAQLARDRQLKALGEMSAVLGHELRNPLASLKGHIQLLLEKLAADHPGRRGAETVLREAVRLEKLSSQILEFARTGAVEIAEHDPVALAHAAAAAVGPTSVVVTVDGDNQPWLLDRARMEEVLSNLLRNATEASSETKSDSAVELAVTIRPGEALVYEVRDRGQGLPAGEEARIFEPFFTRKSRGTGLGLALARRIVEGHGGRITANNRPDGGAVFRVSLPSQGGRPSETKS